MTTTPLSYQDLLQMPQWQSKRKDILRRDDYQCRACGSTSNLHIHHRQYHAHAKTGLQVLPWKYNNNLLITLCASCHRVGHAHYIIQTFSY